MPDSGFPDLGINDPLHEVAHLRGVPEGVRHGSAVTAPLITHVVGAHSYDLERIKRSGRDGAFLEGDNGSRDLVVPHVAVAVRNFVRTRFRLTHRKRKVERQVGFPAGSDGV